MAIALTGDQSILVLSDQLPSGVEKEPKQDLITNGRPFSFWGSNNLLPDSILEEIGKDEVVFRANEFNKATHFGLGLSYCQEQRTKTGIEYDYSAIPEVDDWMEENEAQRLYLELIDDYESLGNIFTGVVLTKNKERIARLLRKEAKWCRWQLRDPITKTVNQMYYNAHWEMYRPDDDILYDVLSVFDPVYDLQSRKSAKEYIYRLKPIAAGRFYYDMASVEVLMNSGNLELKQLSKDAYKALLKNQLGALWHIEITERYLQWRVGEDQYEKMKSLPAEKLKAVTAIKAEIDKWLSGPENKGKTLLTMRYMDNTTQKLESGVIVTPLASKVKQGDWIPSMQQFQAETFYAMGVDPSTIGISNQSDGMNSGSEKKNAFYNTQATLFTERINTLTPFYFAARFNGWTKKYKGFKWHVIDTPVIPMASTSNQNSNAGK